MACAILRCSHPAAALRVRSGATPQRVRAVRPCIGRRVLAAAAKVEQSVNASPENAVRCFMTGAQPFFSVNLCALGDGALVCERLTPGNYRLEAAAPREHGDGNAPRCDPANPTSCLTYVYVLESGQMVCEGLPAGEYEIKQAQPDDVEKMVQHAVRLSQGLSGTERTPEAETAGSEGGWLSKLTGFLRKT